MHPSPFDEIDLFIKLKIFYFQAMPTHCDPPVNVTATHQEVRSGAANPFVKGTPPRQGSAPQRTLTPQHMPLDDNCNAANEVNILFV